MGIKKVTDSPEINSLIAGLNKSFGDFIDKRVYELVGFHSTGSIALDKALGIGGIPKARVVEVLGQPSGGKTSLCMQILAIEQETRRLAAQAKEEEDDKYDVVIDLEHTITGKFMRGFGVNTDRVLHIRPTSAEEALQTARDLPKSGKIGIVIFDSVAAGQSMRMLKKNIGEADVGGISKLMQDAVRTISKLAETSGTTFLFINQITFKINTGYGGNPETTPGGQALKFYASVRLKAMTGKPHPHLPGTLDMRIKILKNKCAPPYGPDPVNLPFRYGIGVDSEYELLDYAQKLGVLRHSAGRSKVIWDDDSEGVFLHEDAPKGRLANEQFLMSQPELYERVKARTIALL